MNGLTLKLFRALGLMILSLLIAGASFNGFLQKWGFRDNPRFSLQSQFDGTVDRPFAYRRLFVDTSDAIDAIVSRSTATSGGPSAAVDRQKSSRRFEIVYYLTFASLLLLLWSAYRLCRDADFSRVTAYGAGAAMVLAFPMIQSTGGYWYDFAETAFFCLFLVAARKGSLPAILILAAIGTWNKESFLLFIPTAWPLLHEGMARGRAMLLAVAACAASAAVYEIQRLRFASHGGATIEFHLQEQLQYLLHPSNFVEPEWTYALPLPHSLGLIGLFALAGLSCVGWPRLSTAQRAHLKVAAALNLPLFILLCAAGEARDLSMMFPTLILLIAASIQHMIDGERAGDVAVIDSVPPQQAVSVVPRRIAA